MDNNKCLYPWALLEFSMYVCTSYEQVETVGIIGMINYFIDNGFLIMF